MHHQFPDAKILDIDLAKGEIKTRIIPGETYRLYPGGSALGLYLILQEMDPKVEPFSPENLLVFSVLCQLVLAEKNETNINLIHFE